MTLDECTRKDGFNRAIAKSPGVETVGPPGRTVAVHSFSCSPILFRFPAGPDDLSSQKWIRVVEFHFLADEHEANADSKVMSAVSSRAPRPLSAGRRTKTMRGGQEGGRLMMQEDGPPYVASILTQAHKSSVSPFRGLSSIRRPYWRRRVRRPVTRRRVVPAAIDRAG